MVHAEQVTDVAVADAEATKVSCDLESKVVGPTCLHQEASPAGRESLFDDASVLLGRGRPREGSSRQPLLLERLDVERSDVPK